MKDKLVLESDNCRVQISEDWATDVVNQLDTVFSKATKAEHVLNVLDKDETVVARDAILCDDHLYLTVHTNEDGFADKITLLDADMYHHDNDRERYLIGLLGDGMCNGEEIQEQEAIQTKQQ